MSRCGVAIGMYSEVPLWQVVPVYYVLFTLCTVLAGAVGFKEFQPENIGL